MAIEAVDTRARGLRDRRAAARPSASTGLLVRLDWLLLARVRGARRLRPLGDRRDHDARRRRLRARRARRCTRRSARVLFVGVAARSTRRGTATLRRPIYFGTLGVMLLRARRRRGDARLAALDRHRLLHVPAVRVRQGAVRARAGRASSPTARERITRTGDRRCAILALRARADLARLRPAGHRHRARLRRRARRGALRRRRALAAPRRCSALIAVAGRARRALAAARGGRQRAQAVPGGAPDRLHASRRTTRSGATYNLTPVDHRGRRRRPARPRRPGRDADAAQLPAGARDRLRVRLARRGARLLRRLDPAAALPARRLARAEDRRRARATSTARSSPAGSPSCSCSRCSSTVAMTMGIAPITGIPLPFVSVGGSSMITNFLAIGILQAIYMRRGRAHGAARVKAEAAARRSLSVVREVRARRGRPAAARRSRARASSCRCSHASCVRAASRPRSSRSAARGRCRARLGRPARRGARCARPRGAGVPIVARHRRATAVPYVLADRHRPRRRRARASRSTEIARGGRRAARRGRHRRSPRGCRCCAPAVVQRADRAASRSRTRSIAAAVFVPGVDMPVLTLNQIRLVLRIALALRRRRSTASARSSCSASSAPASASARSRGELLDLVPGRRLGGQGRASPTPARGRSARRRVRYFEAAPSRRESVRSRVLRSPQLDWR